MEVLLNELSLEAQFETVEDFFNPLREMIQIQIFMEKFSVKLLKHQELYRFKVTAEHTLYDIFTKSETRTSSEVRKFKIYLNRLMTNPPFWQDSQRHSQSDKYFFPFIEDAFGYSIAEACERNRVILSFPHQIFNDPIVDINKNDSEIMLLNIKQTDELIEHLYDEKKVSYRDYCNYKFENTNLSFENLDFKYGFEGIEDEEAEVFISTFKDFSKMNWDEIHNSSGLDFKQYQPSSHKLDWFKNTEYSGKQVYKFRTSRKYRCFGYRENDIFYVLRFELDHSISDHG